MKMRKMMTNEFIPMVACSNPKKMTNRALLTGNIPARPDEVNPTALPMSSNH